MVKRATRKKKNQPTKRRKAVIIIATEGKNKTEKTYFQEFNGSDKRYIIVFARGNNTDPVNIVKDAITTAHDIDIEPIDGDQIYAVFDIDYGKLGQIKDARELAQEQNVHLVLSNPCFEVWLLLHFRYSTREYGNNAEVIKELCNQWPAFRKNIDSFQTLNDCRETALENARRLRKHHLDTKETSIIEKCNPSTEVDELVNRLL